MNNKLIIVTMVTLLFIVSHMIADVKFKHEISKLRNHIDTVSDTNETLREQLLKQASFDRQLECMAMNIYHEARSESYAGQLAVATVTINRVGNEKFPSTVCGVVWQRNKRGCQFSWTCDGRSDKIRNNEAYQEALIVAEKVMLYGTRSTIGKDVYHYHADYVNPNWESRYQARLVAQIDTHKFYKLGQYLN